MASKRGRPTTYTADLAQEICNSIAATSKGTKKLCEENEHWPNKDTIFTWLKNNYEFSDQYARAKRCQIAYLMDEILDIADDVSQDQLVDSQGKIIFNHQAINRARLKIDTRKWMASKLVPKVYGTQPADDGIDLKMEQELKERYRQMDERNRKEY